MRVPWEYENPLCAEVGGELFFSETRVETAELRLAKSICNGCTHKTECLEWALEHDEFGIWGGTNENMRRSIKRMRRNQSA